MKKNTTRCRTYYVSGMHCPACELLLERTFNQQAGIKNTHASRSNHTLTLEYKNNQTLYDIGQLNQLIASHGYSLSDTPPGKVTWSRETVVQAVSIFALLYGVYILIERSGVLGSVTVTEQSPLLAFFVLGLIAGISSCAALVGGLLLSLSRQWGKLYGGNETYMRAVPTVLFLSGRLIAFIVLGGLLGLLGGAITLSVTATSLLAIAVSMMMFIIALQMLDVPYVSKLKFELPRSITGKLANERTFSGKLMPILAGAGTFFLPCGFTLLAQSIALVSGSFISGALIMGAFALGTTPVLAFIGLGSSMMQMRPKTASVFSVTAGIIIATFSLYTIHAQLTLLGFPTISSLAVNGTGKSDDQDSVSLQKGFNDDGTGVQLQNSDTGIEQQVVIKASGFSYIPETLVLQKDVPTTVTIYSDKVIGCAQAMYMPGLYNDVIFLNKPEVTVSFIPQQGTYKISCSMGMVYPIAVTVI